jgi:hypothetical protein
LNRLSWLFALGLVAAPFTGCGPDAKPERLCDGPTFNLIVRAEPGPLPADTRINVRYGGNHEGEPYTLGQTMPGQSVFCKELASWGGAPADEATTGSEGGGEGGAGGAGSSPATPDSVQALACRLFTQGPARVDASATGYEPIMDQPLLLDEKQRCQVDVEVKLELMQPDAGD